MRFLKHECSPRVICLGMSAMDYVWNVPELPVGNTKIRATEFFEMGGGLAATAACACGRLGARISFWSRAGEDQAGRSTRDELQRYGVDTTHYRLFPGQRTSVSGIFVDAAGERMIANFRGAGLPADPSWLPLGDVAAADSVVADCRWVEGVEALFGAARAKGIPSVLDCEIAEPGAYERMLPVTDYAVFSQIGLNFIAPGKDPEAGLEVAAAMGARTVAVTLGAKGSLWLHEGRFRHFPAFQVEVVDTTGAGDVFHGALAVAFGAGADLDEAVTFSAAVAALKCAKAGGRPGIPDLAATKAFLEKSGY